MSHVHVAIDHVPSAPSISGKSLSQDWRLLAERKLTHVADHEPLSGEG
jgi:hypothetical protein